MKNINFTRYIKVIFSLAFICLPSLSFPLSYSITKTQALNIAMAQFPHEDYDYYWVPDASQSAWHIFVDAYPWANWEHDCYTVIVPKISNVPANQITPGVLHQQLPPSYVLEPLRILSTPPVQYSPRPYGDQVPLVVENPCASKTYAIIVNGGANLNSNYFRYWTDCSFLYQVLTKKYGIPKDHIYPLMADGNDPGTDTRYDYDEYGSQNLDLDGDGVDEISLAATSDNLGNVINTLSYFVTENDHVFVFVIDHGGYDTDAYINLWNGEKLYRSSFIHMFQPFYYIGANVNMVLGECYGGNFVEGLTQKGFVVSAGGLPGQSTGAGGHHNEYDSFVYNWTCAINNADHLGRSLDLLVDKDHDGHISMLEAFQYAKVREGSSNPIYSSMPFSVGEELAFDRQPPLVDLYIKDNPEDTGKEPNYFLEKNWLSPSICVRNQDDDIFVHENPYRSSTHSQAYVYVKVQNRGKKNYTGGKHLIVYWSYASAGFSNKAWKGQEVDHN